MDTRVCKEYTVFEFASRHKLAVWAWNMWNPCDVAVVFFFLAGLVLRLQAALMSIGRLLFCVDIIYWYLRIFTILSVNKYLGMSSERTAPGGPVWGCHVVDGDVLAQVRW